MKLSAEIVGENKNGALLQIVRHSGDSSAFITVYPMQGDEACIEVNLKDLIAAVKALDPHPE